MFNKTWIHEVICSGNVILDTVPGHLIESEAFLLLIQGWLCLQLAIILYYLRTFTAFKWGGWVVLCFFS